MEFREDILYPFLSELIEGYRKEIREQDEAEKIFHRQRKLADEVDEKMAAQYPELYKLVTDYVSSIYDLNGICQEQLYIQGVKDGIRIRRLIKEIEEGKIGKEMPWREEGC